MSYDYSSDILVPAGAAQAFSEVSEELRDATQNFPPMNTAHEGFAILKEEVDELWEAVRMKQKDPARLPQMRKEAVQVAAMALRFIVDICEEGNNG